VSGPATPDGGDRVTLRFIGSGDAFGSGGRLQTCLALEGGRETLLIDCGTTSLVGMKRVGVDPNTVGAVLVSHLHGDHFGGIPFLILDGQFRRRPGPLLVAGPPGVRARVEAAMEVLIPGSARTAQRFAVEFVEFADRVAVAVGPARVDPFLVDHASGAPPFALRVAYGGKTVAYSGDTAWTESLVDAARAADVFVCEAYFFAKPIRYHLDYRTLAAHRARLHCPRIILTHMSQDMLDHVEAARAAGFECADDGMLVRL
jgi:ribonuclease BN (tRNA processing enzyme)